MVYMERKGLAKASQSQVQLQCSKQGTGAHGEVKGKLHDADISQEYIPELAGTLNTAAAIIANTIMN